MMMENTPTPVPVITPAMLARSLSSPMRGRPLMAPTRDPGQIVDKCLKEGVKDALEMKYKVTLCDRVTEAMLRNFIRTRATSSTAIESDYELMRAALKASLVVMTVAPRKLAQPEPDIRTHFRSGRK
jgi:hypothetical protein